MKKIIFKNINTIICLLISIQSLYSQVGIGTASPAVSALLDMDVTSLPANKKKGFLLPRVSLKNINDVTTVPAPVPGLWVYNTNTSTGANAVTSNTLYMWTGNEWDAYASTEYINTRISPADYFIRSFNNYILNGSSVPTISSYNSGTLAPIPWESSGVVVDNPGYITKLSDNTSFQINKTGYYDISGFLNYNPNINSSTKVTVLQTILQYSTDNGSTWNNLTSVNSTFEQNATNAVQSITFPYQVIYFNSGNRFRFVLYKSAAKENHVSGAGILASASSISSKSFRISYLR